MCNKDNDEKTSSKNGNGNQCDDKKVRIAMRKSKQSPQQKKATTINKK